MTKHMTNYERVIRTNELIIKGNKISENQMQDITDQFLSSDEYRDNADLQLNNPKVDNQYPIFFIPSGNVNQYKTITMVTPHTQILSYNAYELEILRILALFDRNNNRISNMLEVTKIRLQNTCYGNFCDKGECFDTSLVVLRFFGTVYQHDTEHIKQLMEGIKSHLFDKKRHSGIWFYYLLCLSELPLELAKSEIEFYKDKILQQLQRSYVMNSEHDHYVSPLCKYILRNCLSRLEAYAYLSSRVPYIAKDGRLHFDIGLY